MAIKIHPSGNKKAQEEKILKILMAHVRKHGK